MNIESRVVKNRLRDPNKGIKPCNQFLGLLLHSSEELSVFV